MLEHGELDYELIADKIVGVLREHPMTEEEIAERLSEHGLALGDDPEDEVAHVLDEAYGSQFLLTADGKWSGSQATLSGRWFTHEINDDELANDVLLANVDLLPVTLLIPDRESQPIHDGGSVRYALTSEGDAVFDRDIPYDLIPLAGALVLEPGTLVGLGASSGSLIGLRFSDESWELVLLTPDQLGDSRSLIAAVGSLFDDEDIQPPVGIDQVIGSVFAAHPELLMEPIAPLSTALRSGDLVLFEELIAPADFDYSEWQREGFVRRLRQSHQLDFEQGEATADLISLVQMLSRLPGALRSTESSEDDDQLGNDVVDGLPTTGHRAEAFAHAQAGDSEALAAAADIATQGSINFIDLLSPWLSSAPVAEALLAETAFNDDNGVFGLSLFVSTSLARAPRTAQPGLWWLRGRLWELHGEPLLAKSCFEAALKFDQSWALALISLAKIESDSGQAGAALRLLERAGDEADQNMVGILQGQIPKPRTDVARNAKCPCGSGRKFKQCHMLQNLLPLDERSQWLNHKAVVFFEDNFGDLLLPLVRIRAAHDRSPQALIAALQDGLVVDVALCEGGIFDAFLEHRGELLPADERSMAEQWLLTERSVFDVESVLSGRSLTLRDIRTGDVIEVSERTASTQLTKGDLICTRVLSVADSWQMFGGIEPIRLHERAEIPALLDAHPTPTELLERLSARFAPPTMQTMEGEPVVLCEATIQVEHPNRLAKLFDGHYQREADTGEERSWVELIEVSGADRIRATFTLAGDSLEVLCNSETRFDRALARVEDADPGRKVVSQTREPLDVAKIAAAASTDEAGQESPVSMDPMLDSPELAAALAEMVRGHEKSWLDESIPALAGFTPREAAADPTRRDDLIRLWDSFPVADGNPGLMDPDWLRDALSL